MKIVKMMREGKSKSDRHNARIHRTNDRETEGGGLIWMLGAMGFPDFPAEIYGYQSVIGTGNVIACWDLMMRLVRSLR